MGNFSPGPSLAEPTRDAARAANLRKEWDAIALLGESESTRRLRTQLRRVGPHFRVALLVGEPGTGQEAAARALHQLSPVASGPFVPFAPEDWATRSADENIASARRGTLFLRDLEGLPLAVQLVAAQRLQALDRSVRARAAETRVVAASQCDLRSLMTSGQFRQDLYARVSAVEIKLAPLRERIDDIGLLCDSLLERFRERDGGEVQRIAVETMQRLREYKWPRNLEELKEVVEEALGAARANQSELVLTGHLRELRSVSREVHAAASAEPIARLEDVLRRHVLEVLSRCAGNKVRAAELLGISRSTLYRMLEGGPA